MIWNGSKNSNKKINPIIEVIAEASKATTEESGKKLSGAIDTTREATV